MVMSDRDPMIHIRIPVELKEALQESAKNNDRTMNADVVARLTASLNQDTLWSDNKTWPVKPDGRVREPNPERIHRLKTELAFIDMERSALTVDLAKAPKSAQGLMIRRLADLEQEFSKKESELRLISPEYHGG